MLIGATLVAALGGIVGFYLAVATLPALVLWLMGWSRPMLTGLSIAAVEIVATPLMGLAMAWLSDGPASDALIPTATLLLGGVVPGLARWFAAGTPRAPLATNP